MSFPHPYSDDPFLTAAVSAAISAGKRQRAALGTDKIVDEATHYDVKLRLDRECQEQITADLLAAFPGHTVFGEEGGSPYDPSGHQWIVDPIDGTVNFFHNLPHFCAAIALQVKGETVLAVTYDPNRDELFTALRGKGAWLNGKPLRVSAIAEVREAMISTGFSKGKDVFEQSIELVSWYAVNAQKVRLNGSAALDLAYVAAGRLDIYLERTIRLWDFAGGQLLIEEAGGRVEVEPLPGVEHGYTLVSSNGKVPVRRW